MDVLSTRVWSFISAMYYVWNAVSRWRADYKAVSALVPSDFVVKIKHKRGYEQAQT
ncbi:MAG: hypothetical protein ACPGVA_09135 [Pikeienuella sp.]